MDPDLLKDAAAALGIVPREDPAALDAPQDPADDAEHDAAHDATSRAAPVDARRDPPARGGAGGGAREPERARFLEPQSHISKGFSGPSLGHSATPRQRIAEFAASPRASDLMLRFFEEALGSERTAFGKCDSCGRRTGVVVPAWRERGQVIELMLNHGFGR